MVFIPAVRVHIKLPTYFNNKQPIPPEYFIEAENEFYERYGGYTRINVPAEGIYRNKESGEQMKDFTISYDVFIKKDRFKESDLPILIEEFEKKFQQQTIACYYHDMQSTDVWSE